MANIINLPARSGSIEYDDDEVSEVYDLLQDVVAGQGVAVDDPQDTETKARTRARAMIRQLKMAYGSITLRTHIVPTEYDKNDNPTKWQGAISLKASGATTPDENGAEGAEDAS